MSKFEIEGVVKYPPRGIGLKLEEIERGKDGREFKTLHEVLCFDRQLLGGIAVGDRIKVTGNIGSKKTEFVVVAKNGKEYPVYATQLYARAIVPLSPSTVVTKQESLHVDDDIPF